jgi:dCTP deaminase
MIDMKDLADMELRARVSDLLGKCDTTLELYRKYVLDYPQGLLADHQIARLAYCEGMLEPFVGQKTRVDPESGRSVISYGLTSYGYDIRVSDEFLVYMGYPGAVIDPKRFDPRLLAKVECKTDEDGARYIEIPPNSYALARTVEFFRVPINVLCLCIGKSTYARAGIIVNCTPFEPGWRGYVTLELSNNTPAPARIYANEGIGQVLFFHNWACTNPYGDGKYQDQKAEVTPPKM